MHISRRTCSPGRQVFEVIVLLSAGLPSCSAQTNIASSSASPSPTSLQTTTIQPPISANSNPPSASSSTPATQDTVSDHVFNYYFLIIAAAGIVLVLGVMYLRSRKRQKAAINRSRSQRALARDMESFRARFGMGRTGGALYGTHTGRSDPEEGLDERGEAPPPYVPGSKPPSIRTADGLEELDGRPLGEGEAGEPVELQNLSVTLPSKPPDYNQHLVTETDALGYSNEYRSTPEIITEHIARPSTATRHGTSGAVGSSFDGQALVTRPAMAVIASERFSVQGGS